MGGLVERLVVRHGVCEKWKDMRARNVELWVNMESNQLQSKHLYSADYTLLKNAR